MTFGKKRNMILRFESRFKGQQSIVISAVCDIDLRFAGCGIMDIISRIII